MPLLAALLLASSALVTERRPAMGTLCAVTVVGAEPAQAEAGVAAAFAVFNRVDLVMNEWRPDSPLSALNDAAGKGWVELPADLCEVLGQAKAGAERSGGRFDPTWAAVSDLWRFDGTQTSPPPDALLAERCRLVGHAGLLLEPVRGGRCRARLAREGMRVGLGGFVKGWAVDQAVARLRALGLRDFLVQAGGDLYAGGRRGDAPWRISIRAPHRGELDALAALEVEDRAFSTSADSERAFQSGGRRLHHVLDPRTCRPAAAAQSVSVLARRAADAEVLSKAVMVEGGGAGLALAEAAGAEAVLVDADGLLRATPALARRLLPAPPP